MLAAVLGVATLVPATQASAAPYTYGEAVWSVTSPSGFLGAIATLRSNCLDFANSTEWQSTFIHHVLRVSDGTNFVEAGIRVGLIADSSGISAAAIPDSFWADRRPNGTYYEHWANAICVPGNSLGVAILQDPANHTHWIGSVGGYSISSTNNFSTPATRLEALTDTTSALAHTYGSDKDLAWAPLGGGWVQGWAGATSHATSSATGIANVSWPAQYTWGRVAFGAAC